MQETIQILKLKITEAIVLLVVSATSVAVLKIFRGFLVQILVNITTGISREALLLTILILLLCLVLSIAFLVYLLWRRKLPSRARKKSQTLPDKAVEILKPFGGTRKQGVTTKEVAKVFELPYQKAQYFLDLLLDSNYLLHDYTLNGEGLYFLSQEGRSFLAKKGLL